MNLGSVVSCGEACCSLSQGFRPYVKQLPPVARPAKGEVTAEIGRHGDEVAGGHVEGGSQSANGCGEFILLQEGNAALRDGDSAGPQAAVKIAIETLVEERGARTDRIRRIDENDVETSGGFADESGPIGDLDMETFIAEDRRIEFGEMFAGKFKHARIDLDLREQPDAPGASAPLPPIRNRRRR